MQFTCFSMLGPQYQANLSVHSLYATTVHRDGVSVVVQQDEVRKTISEAENISQRHINYYIVPSNPKYCIIL